MAERIHVEITGDSKDVVAAAAEAAAAIKGVKVAAQDSGRSARDSGRGFSDMDGALGKANRSATAFRNGMMLMKWPAMIAGAGMAAGAINGLAGGLVSVASAAAPASGALVLYPSLLGAIAQGAVAAKLATGGVMEALKASGAAQQKSGADAAASAQQQAAAADRVRSAKERLSQTQRVAQRVQEDLTQARKDARRELDDLKESAHDTADAEQGAALGLRRAKEELRKTLHDPKATQLDRDEALYAVKQAQEGVRDARREHKRAAADYETARKKGVEGSKQVRNAKEQEADAQRNIVAATHEVASAQRDATAAMAKQSAAAATFQQKMSALAPAAQRFVKTLLSYKPVLKDLRAATAQGLFPGVERGMRSAMKNMPVFKRVMASTAKALGDTAAKAGSLLGSKGFGKDFEKLGARNVTTLRRMGGAALNLTSALRHVLVAADPLVNWATKSALAWTKHADAAAKAGRENGKLGHFFEGTRHVLERLGSIAGHLVGTFYAIGKAAAPTGRLLLADFDKVTGRWERWAKSLEGQNKLRAYFEKSRPIVHQVGGLVADLAKAFVSIGTDKATVSLIKSLRTLVPVLRNVIVSTTKAFGPPMIEMIHAIALLFGDLAGATGPLTLFAHGITLVAKGLHAIMTQVPGTRAALVTLMSGVGLYKALQLGAAITGLKSVKKLLAGTAAEAGAGAGAAKGGILSRLIGRIPKGVKIAGGLWTLPIAIAVSGAIASQKKLTVTREQIDRIRKSLIGVQPAAKETAVHIDRVSRMLNKAERYAKGTQEEDYFHRLAKAARGAAHTSKIAFDNIQTSIGNLRNATGRTTGQILSQFRGNFAAIKKTMGTNTLSGAQAVNANMKAAKAAISANVKLGVISAQQGMAAIKKLMMFSLMQVGFTKKEALNELRDANHDGEREGRFDGGRDESVGRGATGLRGARGGVLGRRRFERGGLRVIGREGDAARDDVPLMLPEGAPVITRHQKAALGLARGGSAPPGGGAIPAVVARGEMVGDPGDVPWLDRRARARGFDGLADVFARVDRPHYMAKGGVAGGQSRLTAMVRQANAIDRHHYPYVWGGGHGNFHGPFDCSGAVSSVLHAAGYLNAPLVSGALAHWGAPGPGAVTIFANPKHTYMRIGNRYFGTSGANPGGGAGWFNGSARPGFAVRHVPGVKGDVGAGFGAITAPKWKGPGGSLGKVGQGALNVVAKGASKRLEKLTASMGGGAFGGGDFGEFGGSGSALMKSISKKMGWNFRDWWALDAGESSHGRNLANPNSTARLRGQFLSSNWGKYGPGSDPRRHPSMDEQIKSMARYIKQRYGNPSAAYSAWRHRSPHWYNQGGIAGGVQAFKKGGTPKPAKKATVGGNIHKALAAAKQRVKIARLTKGKKDDHGALDHLLGVERWRRGYWVGRVAHFRQVALAAHSFKDRQKALKGADHAQAEIKDTDGEIRKFTLERFGKLPSPKHMTKGMRAELRRRLIRPKRQKPSAKFRRAHPITPGAYAALQAVPKGTDKAALKAAAWPKGMFDRVFALRERMLPNLDAALDLMTRRHGMDDVTTVPELTEELANRLQAQAWVNEETTDAQTLDRTLGKGIRVRERERTKLQRQWARSKKLTRSLEAGIKRLGKKKTRSKSDNVALAGMKLALKDRYARNLAVFGGRRLVSSYATAEAQENSSTGRIAQQLATWRAHKADVHATVDPTTPSLGLLGARQSAAMDVEDLRKRIKGGGDDAAGAARSEEIASLLREQVAQGRELKDTSDRQFGALQGFAPLLGGRLVGSYAVGGPIIESGMAQVHRGEWIVPDPYGPRRGGQNSLPGHQAAPQVTVILDGDAGPLIKSLDVMVDGKLARADVRRARQGQRVRAAAGR